MPRLPGVSQKDAERISMSNMKRPSSSLKQGTIPAPTKKESFTLKEAEEILKRHGARPATPEEIKEAKKFDKPDY
jgi:hypothetical protein